MNADVIIGAVNSMLGVRLVVLDAGPGAGRLAALAGPWVRLLGAVPDEALRWL
jgi:hypothetical protein